MITMTAPTLSCCQEAVETLYRRITAGRVRALGKAAATDLTGRVTDLDADELAILEAAMSSRYGRRLFDVYLRDDLHATGASEDDWALASELAYQAIRRDVAADRLALTVERIMRAGPYRSKWDDARGHASL